MSERDPKDLLESMNRCLFQAYCYGVALGRVADPMDLPTVREAMGHINTATAAVNEMGERVDEGWWGADE